MQAAALRPQTRINLGLLRELKVPENDVARLRDELHARDQLAVDGFGRVSVDKLSSVAQSLKIALPQETLARLFAPTASEAIVVQSKAGDFPTPKVSVGAPRALAARPVDARLSERELGGLATPLAAMLRASTDATLKTIDLAKDGISASMLETVLTKHVNAARNHLTGEQVEQGLRIACSAVAPAHVERDAQIELDSKYTKLSDGAGGVGLYRKNLVEHLFLRRATDGKTFELHGFEADRFVVTVPPKGSVLIMDVAGHQLGHGLRPEPTKLDGQAVNAVEISRSLAQPLDAKVHVQNPVFTVKVLDEAKNVVHEQRVQFGADPGQRSKKLLTGTFGYGPRPEGVSDRVMAHAVPSPQTNAAPLGERPRFEVDGAACDQLLVARDGKRFPVNRLVQLLHPPRSTKQALRGAGLTWQIDPRSASETALDHPGYDPTAGVRITSSDGRAATFDRKLSETRQARWTSAGLQIFEPRATEPKVTLDPLA